ncbi:MAG: TonB-dependent receptor [Deltaproteobacteria bacterium]|nr:TonB-dependent receptor [Deltaproteobacteria bacterium]
MTKKLFLVILYLSIIVSFVDLSSLYAQGTIDEEFTLEEITVTAQKREENQQKVPMAMSVISADEINTLGKSNLDEILADIPNAVISKANDGLRISLRGIADDTQTNHGQSVSMPTVALNMDGVFSNRKDTGSGLFDLERVEVLYGPQSTLYASNSPGGIVNVVTANPKLDRYEASGLLEYGNYNLLHTEGVLNAPVSKRFAVRAGFQTSVHDGYLSNGGMEDDSKSARLRLLYQANDKLSFVATGEIAKGSSQQFASVDAFVNQDDLDDPWSTTRDLGNATERNSSKIYGRMDWEIGFVTLSMVPSYAKQDGSGQEVSVMPGMPGQSDIVQINEFNNDSDEKTVELRLASSADSSVKWVVGFNYYKSSDTVDSVGYVDSVANGDYRWSRMDEDAKAAFGNITYPVTGRFRATAGYRQSWDNLHNLRDEGTNRGGSIDYQTYDYENKYEKPDYKLGFEYDLSEESMIYADYATSYRNQGMGIQQAVTPPPQKLKAISMGAKNRFFDRKLQLNASAFYYDYANYSATQMAFSFSEDNLMTPEPNPTGSYMYVVQDDGSTTWGDGNMYGLDIDLDAIITSKDNLRLSVSYLKSEWKELFFNYENDYTLSADAGRYPQGMDIIVSLVPLEDVSYKGKPMTHSPEWTINATYKHIFSLWNGGTLEPQIQASYKSSYRLSWMDSDYPSNYQEAFHMINLSAAYMNPDGKWTLSAYVRNLENYASKIGYFGAPVNATMLVDPRIYGAVLSVRF